MRGVAHTQFIRATALSVVRSGAIICRVGFSLLENILQFNRVQEDNSNDQLDSRTVFYLSRAVFVYVTKDATAFRTQMDHEV